MTQSAELDRDLNVLDRRHVHMASPLSVTRIADAMTAEALGQNHRTMVSLSSSSLAISSNAMTISTPKYHLGPPGTGACCLKAMQQLIFEVSAGGPLTIWR
jgi:hypothetical protein